MPIKQETKHKLKVATTSLVGCFGCHMSFLDMGVRLVGLLKHVEFDRLPFTDIKHCGPCDIDLVEGGGKQEGSHKRGQVANQEK